MISAQSAFQNPGKDIEPFSAPGNPQSGWFEQHATNGLGRSHMDTENQDRQSRINERQPSEEDWQARIERLQEVVRILLIKNQAMRMGLPAESTNEQCSGFA